MTIEKSRFHRRRAGGRGLGGGGRGVGSGGRGFGRRRGNRKENLRTAAEQLDYEMELLRAQREGREEEFKTEQRLKLRARQASELDAEMDDYFRQKETTAPKTDEPAASEKAIDTEKPQENEEEPTETQTDPQSELRTETGTS